MSTTMVIASVAPGLFNPNGDAENARVLARRLEWAGIDARTIPVTTADDIPEHVDSVVLGSCSDSDLAEALNILRAVEPMLRAALDEQRPMLAVGNGLDLLCTELALPDGSTSAGLGLIAGEAPLRPTRAVGELVVRTPDGTLVGYENHARDLLTELESLGRVVSGSGNGSGAEGVVFESLIGTHLHGPVLAKNPGLADRMLTRIAHAADREYAPSERASAADDYAALARTAILDGLKISDSAR